MINSSAHQRLTQVAQSRAEAEREDKGECEICFVEGGAHEDWCVNKL